ncbi:uncharacterized protein DUF4389 [Kribbella orskensis]|uniref:Uncharacterized protein DUF4389 n=1 Tax=Kribbella orskensis TaxID=2512216 RepID=A0ABY2B779_9ACTN|nr:MULTISPECIES: DUF4389 domain-containing protein [Kribbella]TCN29630.1 uncharacterized protein DUF4389 [Kribbella sp. VKM Ac-2500]TCO09936.1 uncharacterized protein DUF4389 [Kribbella orskensis]
MNEYPIRLEGKLDPSVSRGLWLVKWLLAIPHYVVLAFLWLACAVLTVIAFFTILFTGRYPRSIFDFTVGVLRWSWRVGFYAYSVLGTDRYPPFTLADVPDYPARLSVDHPPQLSRGLVLVKWLLAFPHLLILGILLGGGPYFSYQVADSSYWFEGSGLIGLLVFITAVALLFTGRYPRDLFDLIMGLNRWVYRVGAYLLLLTDKYPPFRFDGGSGAIEDTPPTPVTVEPREPVAAMQYAGRPAQYGGQPLHRWTAGRVVSVVAGSVLVLAGLGMVPTGAAGLWIDQTARDSNGYIATDLKRFNSPGYAITTEPGALRFDGPDWVMHRVLGKIRITGVSATDAHLFIGIAPEQQTTKYLAPIGHTVVQRLDDANSAEPSSDDHVGQPPAAPPRSEWFWDATASGAEVQTLDWQPRAGKWSVVVMNADGSRIVRADLAVGATLPWLDDVSIALIGTGLLLLLAGAVLIAIPVRRSQQPMTG